MWFRDVYNGIWGNLSGVVTFRSVLNGATYDVKVDCSTGLLTIKNGFATQQDAENYISDLVLGNLY